MITKKFLVVFATFLLLTAAAWAGQDESKVGRVETPSGVSIAYETCGSGEPALVFVHGWCCDRTYWKHQLPVLSKKYKVVAIDLAGHGDSDLGRQDYTMQAFAMDVEAVVDKLDLDRVILVGHLMGEAVIVEAARRLPDRVIGLIGADSFSNVEAYYEPQQIVAFLRPFRRDFEATVRDYVEDNMFTDRTDTALVKLIVDDMASAPPEVAVSAMEHYMEYYMPEALKDMRLPIRTINSNQFPLNYGGGRRYAKDFVVDFMDGVGRFVMLENPQEFNHKLEIAIRKLLSEEDKKQN